MRCIYDILLSSQLWQLSAAIAQLASPPSSILGQTTAYGDNTYTETWLTPTAYGYTYYWSRDVTPTILGTVYVIISHGQTSTSTYTKPGVGTEYMTNGTLALLTRTDVNEDGTVTTDITGTKVTYPTEYIGAEPYITWQGLVSTDLPTACCVIGETSSPTPRHSPYPSATGTVDSEDPTGWLYHMHIHLSTAYGRDDVSSLFAPASIGSVMQYCPYPLCASSFMDSPVSAAGSVTGLLKTSTVHVSATPSSTGEKHSSGPSSTSTSALVDPVSRSHTKTTHASSETNARQPSPTNTPPSSDVVPASESATQKSDGVHTGGKHTKSPERTGVPTHAEDSTSPTTSTHTMWPSPKHKHTHHSLTNIHHRPTRTITITDWSSRSISTLIKTITVTDHITTSLRGSTRTVTTTEVETTYLNAPPIIVGSAVITPNSRTEYVIFSQTLSPGGPPITVSGTEYSLEPGATELIEGHTTETLTTKHGIGGYVWLGLGGSTSKPSPVSLLMPPMPTALNTSSTIPYWAPHTVLDMPPTPPALYSSSTTSSVATHTFIDMPPKPSALNSSSADPSVSSQSSLIIPPIPTAFNSSSVAPNVAPQTGSGATYSRIGDTVVILMSFVVFIIIF